MPWSSSSTTRQTPERYAARPRGTVAAHWRSATLVGSSACAPLQTIGEHYLAVVCDPEVGATCRVVIAESVSYPKIAQLFHEAGPAPGQPAMDGVIGKPVEAGHLGVDDSVKAAHEFSCLLRGTHRYDLMLGLRSTPDRAEQRSHVERVVGHFPTLYGTPSLL